MEMGTEPGKGGINHKFMTMYHAGMSGTWCGAHLRGEDARGSTLQLSLGLGGCRPQIPSRLLKKHSWADWQGFGVGTVSTDWHQWVLKDGLDHHTHQLQSAYAFN